MSTVSYATCPACSSPNKAGAGEHPNLSICLACGAIFGQLYLGDSYGVVRPQFHPDANSVPDDRQRYFDFVTLGSQGVDRRHGWYDTLTGYIIQVG